MIVPDQTQIIHGNALDLPLPDASVDLVITSPPYFALRSYRDGDEHFPGQIGSEATPAEFLEALWAATAEMVRVLKPTGSLFVNLGDKYAGSGGHNNSAIAGPSPKSTLANPHYGRRMAENATRRDAPDRYNQNSGGIPAKSLMGLPWRYAIGCIDQLGLILRAEVIWSKPNGLPESVTDRVRRSHEQWFHFTKQGRYFSAVDEVREAHSEHCLRYYAPGGDREASPSGNGRTVAHGRDPEVRGINYATAVNPLGKLPGSVWTIATDPLTIPEWARDKYDLPDHFAAFPQEWPRRLILGWSPSGICTKCGDGRRPVVEKDGQSAWPEHRSLGRDLGNGDALNGVGGQTRTAEGKHIHFGERTATITGYACACTEPTATTAPAVVLDPFCGTGTVPLVARALGRTGIGVDLSADYCRLAEWRVFESGAGEKAERRTWAERQIGLL